MTLGEIFVSFFISVLLDRLASRELLEVATQWKIDSEVMKLRLLVSKIDAVTKDVEEKQMEDSAVKLWFDELQDLADDAEDLVDNIKKITERFNKIAKEIVKLGLRENVVEKATGLWRTLPLTSLLVDHVFGRKEDTKKLIDFLTEDIEAGVSVVSLVGQGGVGDFDLVKVTKAILESLGKGCSHVINLEPLQKMLKKKLESKKFLLGLDDLWNKNYGEWDVLRLLFRAGAPGSQIIITTRSKHVAQTVGIGPIFCLQELSEDDCWTLFAHHAFSGLNSATRPNLEIIGKRIANKCKGLPLAARHWEAYCTLV
ncbi:putative disease resistance RPP13-like protein 1 [Pistacia vera]|uniref:putative disease resistance RPP13-like protein 1 n=1 Tax=Pistacia vera TaxID=55513 RepID=UPI0012638121|nr:putative disease resistance RPP13-like protein 1 [Pistacia vera]